MKHLKKYYILIVNTLISNFSVIESFMQNQNDEFKTRSIKMVKHIVVWKLKDSAHGNSKEQNALLIKEKLEALNGRINGLLKLEVGIDLSKTESSANIVLYSEFASKEDLDFYQAHPDHRALIPFITEARSERILVDYEV